MGSPHSGINHGFREKRPKNSWSFLACLAGLAAVPLLPVLCLDFRNHEGLDHFRPIGYYEYVIVFLLLAAASLFAGTTASP